MVRRSFRIRSMLPKKRTKNKIVTGKVTEKICRTSGNGLKPEDNLGIMNSLFYMIRSVISETRYLVLEVFMKRTILRKIG